MYDVLITGPNNVSAQATVTCRDYADLTVVPECAVGSNTLTFTVTNNGGPSGNLDYVVTGPNGYSQQGTISSLNTGESATVDLGSVPPGVYDVSVTGPNNVSAQATVTCIDPTPTPPSTGLTVVAECAPGTNTLTLTVTNTGSVSDTVSYTVTGPNGFNTSGNVGTITAGGTGSVNLGTVGSGVYDVTVTGSSGASAQTTVTCQQVTPPSSSGICDANGNVVFTITNTSGAASLATDYVAFGPNGNLPGGTLPALNPGDSTTVTYNGQAPGVYSLFTVDNSITVTAQCSESLPTPTPYVCVPPGTPGAPGSVVVQPVSGTGPGFPSVNVSAADASCYEALPAAPWEPLEIGGAICPDWIVYHTNITGDWEVFRLGELPEEPNAEVNLTQGVGERVYDVSPARSPDSQWIAFASNRDGQWEIYIGRTNGSEQRRVTYNTALETSPSWSPDGRYIAYQSNRNGNWDLYMIDVTSGVETRLTEGLGNEIHPSWSPNSDKLLFQSDVDGIWQIYELTLFSTEAPVLLSDGAGDDHDAHYSNNGDMIAFRSYRDGINSVVYVMNSDGTEVTRVSDVAGDAINHVFSPEDSLIAYESNLDGDKDIYVYEIETQQTRLLTENTTLDVAPTWICESTQIVWTSDATEDINVGADNNIFNVNALPIDAPAINVKAEASQMTFEDSADQYPQSVPAEENASREGQVPGRARNR